MAKNEEKGEIVLYQPEGEVRLEVRMDKKVFFLRLKGMGALFSGEPSKWR